MGVLVDADRCWAWFDVRGCVGVCASTSLVVSLAVCVIEEKQETNNPGAGALQKHADSWTPDKATCRERKVGCKQLTKKTSSIGLPLTYPHARSLKSKYTINPPTFLPRNTDFLPSHSAHVGGVVREFVCEALQGQSVAVGLQLLNIAFAFELALCRWSGHVGVKEGHFVSRGPGELIGVDLVWLRLDLTVYPQVVVIFNTHGDLITLYFDQQDWEWQNKSKCKNMYYLFDR